MKLLMVSSFFDSHNGGLEIVAGSLFRAFSDRNCEIGWAAGNVTAPPDISNRTSAISLPVSNRLEDRIGVPFPIPSPRALGIIAREVAKADVLLVHDCLYLGNIAAFIMARLRSKRTIIVQHIGPIAYRNPIIRTVMKLGTEVITRPMLAAADQVIFISEKTKHFFSDVHFRSTPEVIFNGVDVDLYRPASDTEKADLRCKLGLPNGQPVVLFVGRFVEKKGMASMQHLAAMRPDWLWAFAGWGPLDPSAWKMENVRIFSGLRGSSMSDLYRACDCLVLPSWGEGFPLVIQEALACGLPVICASETLQADPAMAAHVRGAPVYPGEDRRTALAFAPVIEDVLLGAPEQQNASETRRAFAASRYSWARAAERYLDTLGRFFSSSHSAPSSVPSAAIRNLP